MTLRSEQQTWEPFLLSVGSMFVMEVIAFDFHVAANDASQSRPRRLLVCFAVIAAGEVFDAEHNGLS